jgi:hypothetical protein
VTRKGLLVLESVDLLIIDDRLVNERTGSNEPPATGSTRAEAI